MNILCIDGNKMLRNLIKISMILGSFQYCKRHHIKSIRYFFYILFRWKITKAFLHLAFGEIKLFALYHFYSIFHHNPINIDSI